MMAITCQRHFGTQGNISLVGKNPRGWFDNKLWRLIDVDVGVVAIDVFQQSLSFLEIVEELLPPSW